MNARFGYAVAVATCATLSAAGAVRWHAAKPIGDRSPVQIVPVANLRDDSLETAIAAAEDVIVANDPFRLANEPALVRYDPANESDVATTIAGSARVRPNLILKAIVGGPPWQAVIDGLPGQPPNTVVRAGTAYDKLVARAVTRDSVVIQGPDTAWVLSFRRPE